MKITRLDISPYAPFVNEWNATVSSYKNALAHRHHKAATESAETDNGQ